MATVGRNLISFVAKKNRIFSAANARQLHVVQQGRPGNNLPFDIHNSRKLAVTYALFIMSSFSIPFVALAYQLAKK